MLVFTVHGDGRHRADLFTLRVVLQNLPVLLDRYVHVAEFDLSHLLLFDHGELLPLDGKRETVSATRINIGYNPDIFDVRCDDFVERLNRQLLIF